MQGLSRIIKDLFSQTLKDWTLDKLDCQIAQEFKTSKIGHRRTWWQPHHFQRSALWCSRRWFFSWHHSVRRTPGNTLFRAKMEVQRQPLKPNMGWQTWKLLHIALDIRLKRYNNLEQTRSIGPLGPLGPLGPRGPLGPLGFFQRKSGAPHEAVRGLKTKHIVNYSHIKHPQQKELTCSDVPRSWPRVSSSRPNRSSAPVEDRSAAPKTHTWEQRESNVGATWADSNGAKNLYITSHFTNFQRSVVRFPWYSTIFHDIIFIHIPSSLWRWSSVEVTQVSEFCWGLLNFETPVPSVPSASLLDESPQDSAASAPATGLHRFRIFRNSASRKSTQHVNKQVISR